MIELALPGHESLREIHGFEAQAPSAATLLGLSKLPEHHWLLLSLQALPDRLKLISDKSLPSD